LETQVELAALASDQLLQYFITGEATYLDVLSANQTQQRLQRSLLSARLDLILIRIGLYLALAGDFDTRPIADFVLPSDVPQLPSEMTFEDQNSDSASDASPATDSNSNDLSDDFAEEASDLVAPSKEKGTMLQPAKEIKIYD
jgi:hypothetical protein